MDILNRIRVSKFLKEREINEILNKTNKDISNISISLPNIVDNDVSVVKNKYNVFIDDVTNILKKTDKSLYRFNHIFPGTSYTQIGSAPPDFSIQYSSVKDYLTIKETQQTFDVFNSPIFTHSNSNYYIITEGEKEHYVDVTFRTPINVEQYYVFITENNEVYATKEQRLRVNSELLSKYALQKFTKTNQNITKYISQPYAYFLLKTGDKSNIVTKTANLETKDIHTVRITKAFIGVLNQQYPIKKSISIITTLPKNATFKISETSDYNGVEFTFNETKMDHTTIHTNFGKDIIATFLTESSYIKSLVLELI